MLLKMYIIVWIPTFTLTERLPVVEVLIYVVHFSTSVLIRHLWQLKTVIFLYWSHIPAVPFVSFHKLE
jgi:hypothetical protein